jgi:hypothetical protein
VVGSQKVTLVENLAERDHALWLERVFEDRLGLPDLPIAGELSRRG